MEELDEMINPEWLMQPDFEDWLQDGCRKAEETINTAEDAE